MQDVFVGRQPIFDRNRNVVAWELLFRQGQGPARGDIADGTQATAQTMINAIVEIGLDRVAAPHQRVYLNCTREFLEKAPLLPPDRCVLEVLEDIPMDDSLLAALDRLRDQGYIIALDDFVFEPTLAPLVMRSDIVKLDVLSLGLKKLEEQVRALVPFGVRLLAEKVDSEPVLDACKRMGCELFQGYYLRRPETLAGKSARAGKLSALVLLSECQKDNVNLERIGQILASDPGLSFKTLQLANSSLFSVSTPISSIRQAISLIGLDSLARWAALLILSGIEDCPSSYLERALERGRMCELLARPLGLPAQTAYLVGLLSILDAATQTSFAELAPRLPVTTEIKQALADRSGDLGHLLEAVVAYQTGAPVNGPVSPELLHRHFWDACQFAAQTTASLGLQQPQGTNSSTPPAGKCTPRTELV